MTTLATRRLERVILCPPWQAPLLKSMTLKSHKECAVAKQFGQWFLPCLRMTQPEMAFHREVYKEKVKEDSGVAAASAAAGAGAAKDSSSVDLDSLSSVGREALDRLLAKHGWSEEDLVHVGRKSLRELHECSSETGTGGTSGTGTGASMGAEDEETAGAGKEKNLMEMELMTGASIQLELDKFSTVHQLVLEVAKVYERSITRSKGK